MVEMGKEHGFTSNFDMQWPFTPRKMELPRKMANSKPDCRTAFCIPEYKTQSLTNGGFTLGERIRTKRIFQCKCIENLSRVRGQTGLLEIAANSRFAENRIHSYFNLIPGMNSLLYLYSRRIVEPQLTHCCQDWGYCSVCMQN